MEAGKLETGPCPVCSGNHLEDIWTFASGVTNGICLDCGHVHLTRRPDSEAIEKTYKYFGQSYSDEYLRDKNGQIFQTAENRFNIVRDHLSAMPENVLEIGCAYGHFLSLFGPDCFRVGIEPSREQVRFAREYFQISELWEKSYEKIPDRPSSWPKAGFDLICSFHVLEHIENLKGFLTFAKRFLRVGGHLCLAVPNLFTLHLDLIELFFLAKGLHLHTFTPDALLFLMKKQGFKLVASLEEEPTPMLRSSSLAVFNLDPEIQSTPKRVDISRARRAMSNFHQSLETRLSRVRKAFQRWTDSGKKIAIYGGGVHTKALLELSGVDPGTVRLIIDDDPAKQNQTLFGIPILSLPSACEFGLDIIVVSSLAAEHLILDRLHRIDLENIDIVGIYKHLMNDLKGK